MILLLFLSGLKIVFHCL